MLTRALHVTNEEQEGTRYSVFFPATNSERSIQQGVGNVIGSLSHLHLDGHAAEEVLTINIFNLPEQGYAQMMFEHGLLSPERLAEAQRLLNEDLPGQMVTVFVPEELGHLRRIVYNTLIVCSQSVHGSVRLIGQKTPSDAAAVLLARAEMLLDPGQYRRLSTGFATALADELEETAAAGEDEVHQAHLKLASQLRQQSDAVEISDQQTPV